MRPGRPALFMLVFTVVGLAIAGLFALLGQETATDVSLIAVAVAPLIPLVKEMWDKLKDRQPGVDVIALLAVMAALALGELLTAAIVGLMLATGQYLESYAAGRAVRELTSLINRAPKTANLQVGDRIEVVDIEDVRRGDRLVIRAGEVIPVDGVIVSGDAVVDESALTGEPIPVERAPGDLVSSGSVNAAELFEIQATEESADSTYAGIVRLVTAANESKAPAVRLADRWAAWFVPLALGGSALAWMISGDPMRGLAVLVVATPCPLLLAVPIAIVSGISRGARHGVVFRGGGALEELARTENVVIDKTGTVTVGRPVLKSITVFDHAISDVELLRIAASVDQVSAHVLARAIVDAAHERDLELTMPTDVNDQHGSGVIARIGHSEVAVGKLSWVAGLATEPDDAEAFRTAVASVSPTVAYVAIDGRMAGAFIFDDRVRPDAAYTIRALRRRGVGNIVMATGDHSLVAGSVGLAVGVDEVLAEATPAEKVAKLRDLQLTGVTTMVGDGINDAPALAAADVGVAMGARGATASSEAADIVIIVDRLQRVVDAIAISQRSRRIAVQSVVIGMGLSVVAMGFAAFGLLIPIAGALVQEAIDVVAILNALRALGGRVQSQTGPTLPRELSQELRVEHDRLMPQLDLLRDVADGLESGNRNGHVALEEAKAFLVDEILPHEASDETEVYPRMVEILPGDDPLATMSRAHREIFQLIESYQRQVDALVGQEMTDAQVRDLRRTLYGLHAILRLHFDQEEELYASLEGA